MHIQALKELGVDLEEAAAKANKKDEGQKAKKPIEDILK